MERILLVTILSLLNGIFLWYLGNSSKGKIDDILANNFVLKMHPMGKFMGFVTLLIGAVISWLIYANTQEYAIPIITFLVLSAFGLFIAMYSKHHKVIYSKNEIQITNAFKAVKTIQWKDIQSIKLNHLLNLYCIKTKKGKFYINQYMVGINAFLHICEELKNKNVA